MSVRNYSNTSPTRALAGALSPTATSVTLDDGSGFPGAPFTAAIDLNGATEELVLVTAVAGNVLTVTRGFDGTAASAHDPGASFRHVVAAVDFAEANTHVNTSAGVHGTTGNAVGTQGTQTLEGKTLKAGKAVADATAGDAFTAEVPTGVTKKAYRATKNSVEQFSVDADGNVNANGVHARGLLETDGDAQVDGNATVSGNAAVGGTLAVTGVTTLTGALAANGGLTVPAGKKATLTDAPVAGTDAVNKTYVDGLGTASATANALAKRDAAGRLQVATPAATGDAATKGYADGLGTSTVTASTIARRDSAGRLQLTSPSASADAATKGYVDGRIAAGVTTIIPAGAGVSTSRAISYGQTFTATPVVVATANSGATSVQNVGVTNVGTSGCTIWLTRDSTSATDIYWIAALP